MQETPQEEKRLGMGVFATDTEPLGGRLRDKVEDFVVEELSNKPPHVEDGDYTALTITARNWETNRLIRQLSRTAKLPRKAIFFAGTKDKRAITTQQFVLACPAGMVEGLEISGVEVGDVYPTDRPLVIGDLRGNRFNITIRGVESASGDTPAVMVRAAGQLEELGGFLNYFGVQRFGAVRPITHTVGGCILRGQFRRAVWTYLTAPGKSERPSDARARAKLRREQDLGAALEYYPSELLFERTLLGQLSRRPEDWVAALRSLPPNLLSMFVHAYQSHLFNQLLTRRCAAGLPPGRPVEGDLVVPLNARGVPDHHETVPVEAHNLERIDRRVRAGKAFVTGMIMGSESVPAGGPMGELERAVMEDNDILSGHFIVPEIPKLSSRGMRRELVAPAAGLEFEIQHNCVRLSFSLYRGTYATCLLREFMKSRSLLDY